MGKQACVTGGGLSPVKTKRTASMLSRITFFTHYQVKTHTGSSSLLPGVSGQEALADLGGMWGKGEGGAARGGSRTPQADPGRLAHGAGALHSLSATQQRFTCAPASEFGACLAIKTYWAKSRLQGSLARSKYTS